MSTFVTKLYIFVSWKKVKSSRCSCTSLTSFNDGGGGLLALDQVNSGVLHAVHLSVQKMESVGEPAASRRVCRLQLVGRGGSAPLSRTHVKESDMEEPAGRPRTRLASQNGQCDPVRFGLIGRDSGHFSS